MKRNGMRLYGSALVIALFSTACVEDGEDGQDEAAEDAGEDEDGVDIEDRVLCLYSNTTPPLADDTATLLGAVDEVESEDYADGNGVCDLHVFRVTANPAADRARTVGFGASSYAGFDDTFARVWTKNKCALGGACPVNFTAHAVTLTILPGFCDPGLFCVPDLAYGTLELSASNNFGTIAAGMRASDVDGEEVEVTITVSE